MARKLLPVLTGNARKPRQEQTVQDPVLSSDARDLYRAIADQLYGQPVEIVPEARPDYILRREQRQAFADRVNGGSR